jgi:hypothetical protein
MANDEELFDDAKSEFLGMEDVDGRLLLIWATGVRRDLIGKSGGKYDAVEARYVILDGKTTERIDQVPMTVDDGLFSAGTVVAKLKNRVGKKPILGRVDSRPSSFNKNVPAYGLADPTEEDRVVARKYLTDNPVDPFA